MNTLNVAILGINILLVALVFHFVPMMRKRRLFFGVTIDDTFRDTDTARDITRRYRLLVWGGTIATLLLLWASSREQGNLLAGLSPVLQALIGGIAWVIAWLRAKPHVAKDIPAVRTVTLGDTTTSLPGGLTLILIPFLGPVAAAWHLWHRYEQLPQRYPIHWNAAGQADRFTGKNLVSVFFQPAMTTAVLLLVALIAMAIYYGARRGTSGERAGWSARYRRLNLLMFVSVLWVLSFLLSIPAFGSVIPPDTMPVLIWISLGILFLVILGFAIPVFRMTMEATGGTDATPEECWRAGLFYYNPNDPALIVEKRDGPGFTLNFGNRLSWAIGALIVIIAVAPFLLRTHGIR